MTPVLLITILTSQLLPSICHRLITDPYLEQQYDSVIVSSDSIKITEKKENDTTPLKPNQILRPQKRSYEECPQNDFACLYGNEKSNNQIVDKFLEQYSNAGVVENQRNATDEGNFRSHWTMIDAQTHHQTRDDSKAWVTLDPIPWSTSKISKWHPNKVVSQHGIYESSAQRPVEQFWASGSSLHEQKPASQWGIGTNDIITDNRPSDFPIGPHHGYGNSNQHITQGMNYPQQTTLYNNQGNFNDYHHQSLKGIMSPHSQQTHPSTYPYNGNGEWVLLSATKGYSHPPRHRWAGVKDFKTELRSHSSRNMKPVEISRYHEENLSDKFVLSGNLNANRKSDEVSGMSNSTSDGNEKALQILYTGPLKNEESVTTTRRKVRLQVLPALENSSTLHGGLLEVDSNSQSVDEAKEEDDKLKNLRPIPIVKKNKIRGYKLIPTSKFTGKSSNHKHVMTLAAVGAGMIPASMALLVPMALGRRRRSLPPLQPLHEFLPTGKTRTLHKF